MNPNTVTGLQVSRSVQLTIDGQSVTVAEGTTLLNACRATGKDVPTLCYGDTITPKNACRLCMVELEGSRVLVPSCSRPAEAEMVVHTDTDRTRHSRKLVLELLGSSVDLSLTN
ncbi:MAG: 2Fe-2S iron-sulfur cluster-binding protein, partial [Actinomycetota bacterium]